MSYLIQLLDSGKKKTYELKVGVNKIGRQLDNHIVISDNLMSRYHAEIIIESKRTIVRDLKSRNRTYVNRQPVTESVLEEGDIVAFGTQLFRYAEKKPALVPASVPQTRQPSILKQFSVKGQNFLDKIASSKSRDVSVIKVEAKEGKERALAKLKLLIEVSQKLCSPQEPEAMLSTIMKLLFQIMDIDRGVILLVDELTQELECKTIKLKEGIEPSESFYSTNIVNLVWKSGDALLAIDRASDERFKQADSIINSSIYASICVPLKANNNLLGVLYVDNLSMSSVYSDEDVEFLTGLANISATAIHMATIYKKRERELQQQIEELQIKIDPKQRQKETLQTLEGIDLERFNTIKQNFKMNE